MTAFPRVAHAALRLRDRLRDVENQQRYRLELLGRLARRIVTASVSAASVYLQARSVR